jgi:hypothetical protein
MDIWDLCHFPTVGGFKGPKDWLCGADVQKPGGSTPPIWGNLHNVNIKKFIKI